MTAQMPPPITVDQLFAFEPTPPLEPMVEDTAGLIAVRAANGAGKSFSVMYKLARAAVRTPGGRFRVAGPTRAQVRDVTGSYLWHFLRHHVRPDSRWSPGTGWNRHNTVCLPNGAEISLRSYEDPPDSHEGVHRLEIIVLDEVPTKAIYMANKGRARQLILSFTVQTKAPPTWLRDEIEGGEESPTSGRTVHRTGYVQYVVPFLRENVPFYDDLEFEAKASKYRGTEDEGRRIWAAWESSSETRKFGGWRRSMIRSNAEIRRMLTDEHGRIRGITDVRIGIDHGTGVGKQCQYLVLVHGHEPRSKRYFVVHEWVGGGNTTPTDNAQGLKKAIDAWLGQGPAALMRISKAYGDVNSSGPAGAGVSLNMLTEQALARIYGLETLPFSIVAPRKDEGFKDAREVALNHAMLEGRVFVTDQAPRLIRAFQNYEGGPRDPDKDPIDAVCYSSQDLLLDRGVGTSAQLRRA